jgi:hypothetical protein
VNETARDGWWQLLRAEWTKLWSVRRWTITMLGAAGLTVLLSVVVSGLGTTDVNRYPTFVSGPDGTPVDDEFQFASQPVTGDATMTAHVVSQTISHEWAGAGIMMKDGHTSGSRYAAVLVTPKHGVRMQANFTTDHEASDPTSMWLRLVRIGDTVTGYESKDGVTWREIGRESGLGLPPTVEIGLFVSSPARVVIERQAGSTSVGEVPTTGRAVFDAVRLDGHTIALTGRQVRRPAAPEGIEPPTNKPPAESGGRDSGTTVLDGVYTLTGSGKIGPNPPPDDIVQVSLFGVFGGIIALIGVGVLSMTSEFKRGLLRTTFAASPRRGRVLAAKAGVLGAATFGVGLVASVTAFLLAQPVLRSRGWTLPAHPPPSLADGPVLRAVVTAAVFIAAVALLSLGLATILRHSAAAITSVIGLVVLPFILGSVLPAEAARWLLQVTPAAGFATLRAKPPTVMLVDPSAMIDPWLGLGVACLYAMVSLAGGWWLLRRRDV